MKKTALQIRLKGVLAMLLAFLMVMGNPLITEAVTKLSGSLQKSDLEKLSPGDLVEGGAYYIYYSSPSFIMCFKGDASLTSGAALTKHNINNTDYYFKKEDRGSNYYKISLPEGYTWQFDGKIESTSDSYYAFSPVIVPASEVTPPIQNRTLTATATNG